ncbi:MAG: hypothetical protein V4735_03250 [Pseudomonadota bacterium]
MTDTKIYSVPGSTQRVIVHPGGKVGGDIIINGQRATLQGQDTPAAPRPSFAPADADCPNNYGNSVKSQSIESRFPSFASKSQNPIFNQTPLANPPLGSVMLGRGKPDCNTAPSGSAPFTYTPPAAPQPAPAQKAAPAAPVVAKPSAPSKEEMCIKATAVHIDAPLGDRMVLENRFTACMNLSADAIMALHNQCKAESTAATSETVLADIAGNSRSLFSSPYVHCMRDKGKLSEPRTR